MSSPPIEEFLATVLYDTIADLNVKCATRHCKVGIFIRNH